MLKDIIYLSATLLNLDDEQEFLRAYEENLDLPEEEKQPLVEPSNIAFLTSLVNIVMRTATREYMPLYYEEEKTSNSQCEIYFTDLSKPINQVVSVSFADGLACTFRTFNDCVKVGYPNQRYKVLYSFYPSNITSLESEIDRPLGLDDETIALGVCSEFCTVNSLYDEADMWEEKYKNSLLNAIRTRRERRVKSRGWL